MSPSKGRPPKPGPRNLRVYRIRSREGYPATVVYRQPIEWVVPDLKGAILNVMLLSEFKQLAGWGRRFDEVMRADCPGLTEAELYTAASILGTSVERIAKKSPLPRVDGVELSGHGDET